MAGLRSKTVNSLFWSLSDTFGAYFIRFGFSVAIARALSPSDYGLMGMILIFIALGNLLSESGFGMALINKKEATEADFSTIFYFNLTISLIIYLILFFSAHLIAEFYKEPILIKVIRVSALTIIFSALNTIQTVILTKELSFRKQTLINFCATIISGTTGVLIAYNGYAVWALVFQTLAGSIMRLGGLWITSNWCPSFVFHWRSLTGMYRFGYKIFLSGLSDVVFSKLYFPLIGKYFSSADLGYYTNASSFSTIIVRQTAIAYGRVLFPAMSSIQDDVARLNRSYNSVFRLLSFVMFPVSVTAIVSSHAFVDFFLTEKWLPAVPYIQLFLFEGFFFALFMLNQNIFNAIGESGISLKVEIIKKVLVFISLVLFFQYGIKALIIGQVVGSLIAFIISFIYINIKMHFKVRLLIVEISKLILVSVFMLIFDNLILTVLFKESGIQLLSKVILLPSIYLLLGYIIKLQALNDLTIVFEKFLPVQIKNIIRNRYFKS